MKQLWQEARKLLCQYYSETGRAGQDARLAEVQAELAETGSYTLHPDELAFGARVAWRNSVRCIGRRPWQALHVRDLRHVSQPAAIFAALQDHLAYAFHGGHIRPTISIFGPNVRILSPQLIRYAGYVADPNPVDPSGKVSGKVLGDPQHVALTQQCMQLGWQPPTPRSAFDVLPLLIEDQAGVHLFEWQPKDIHEVPLSHPDFPAFAELGLRWHALPVISNMALQVGGLSFACAPFNGWYMQTEIAARNLADEQRYNLLPAVALAMGLDTSSPRTLWQDRALVELNVAVLHSFAQAGVKITDHHSADAQFQRFVRAEQQAGREVYGLWSWLIPPLSPATTAIWAQHYNRHEPCPRFRKNARRTAAKSG